MLSRRKKVVFMEANNIFKTFFKSLKIDKNNSQNQLAQQKKIVKSLCCTNLKFAFIKCFLKTVKKMTESRINYNFFSQEN